MKTLFLLTICVVMFGAASHAQTDTTRFGLPRDTSRNRIGITPAQPAQPVQPAQPAQPTQPQVQPMLQPTSPTQPQAPAGWTPMNNQTIPDNLRQTLNTTPAYQGWQNGSIYSNPNTGMYQLQTNDLNNPQTYYFDKSGKLTTAPPHD